MWREFKAFLLKQNVLALAIAVIVGTATGAVVQGIVNDFIMPVVQTVTPAARWQDAEVVLGAVRFKTGHFSSELLNFVIVAFVAWQITRLILRPAPAAEPATQPCPYCKMNVDAAATRCAYCTSELTPAA